MRQRTVFEKITETCLWNSRFIVWVAVISCMFATLCSFWIITVDTFGLVDDVIHYSRKSNSQPGEAKPVPGEAMPVPGEAMPVPGEAMPVPGEAMPIAHAEDHNDEPPHGPTTATALTREEIRAELTVELIEVVDGFLLATFLLIFTLGLYELFISKIDEAETFENRNNVLKIHSLDDLKTRLGRVVLMILIVNMFKNAQGLHLKTGLDFLYFGGGIALVSAALYLTHAGHDHGAEPGHGTGHGPDPDQGAGPPGSSAAMPVSAGTGAPHTPSH